MYLLLDLSTEIGPGGAAPPVLLRPWQWVFIVEESKRKRRKKNEIESRRKKK